MQQRPRQEPVVEEYKAKTVIEYDHQALNVVTPALIPATVKSTEKKKVIYTEPKRIFDYNHSSEEEAAIIPGYNSKKYFRVCLN
jgi:hypothetical protein